MYTTLIEPAELATNAGQAGWVIVDCRFDLARPEWGATTYAEGHIPGALYAHLDRDLSGPVTSSSGRHPLPTPEAFAATAGRWGIDGTSQVIAYDQGNGAYASRLWWLLRWAGHEGVAVLNGGFAAWRQAGLAITAQPAATKVRRFLWRASRSTVTSTAEIQQLLNGGGLATGQRLLIDARSADRFAGQNETLDPVAGHIPFARNRPFANNLEPSGRFLPPSALRARWLEILGSASPAQVIAMCGSGVTACHNLLALEAAGLTGATLYAGSWSEWIRDAARPVTTQG